MLRTPGPVRRLGLIIVAATALLVFSLSFNKDRYKHQIQADSIVPSDSNHNNNLFCERHGFPPWGSSSARRRKVYDLFLLSHELDWLEIRLNTLAPYVDYFVIVESSTTFTGMSKPLYLQEHWSNYTQFHDKIIHRVVVDPGASIGRTTWAHEDFFRNALFHSSFPTLVSTDQEAQEGDVLLVSDVDEIPKSETLQVLRHCDFPDRLTLRSHFYYYSFQWQHRGEQWPHPQATVFHGLSNTLSPVHLREGIGGPFSWIPFKSMIKKWQQRADLWNAAWHCSSCFATMAEMRAKMASFSHTPLNTEENRNETVMMDRVRTGQDLFGRKGEKYDRVENNQDLPKYVLEHEDSFRYMLNRDGEDAGFRDWQQHQAK